MTNWNECFRAVCESLYRIQVQYSGGVIKATGFVVAKYREPDKLTFALATAEHVFRPLPDYENLHWTVERYRWSGVSTGVSTFQSNLERVGNSPTRSNTELDVGLLFMPETEFSVF